MWILALVIYILSSIPFYFLAKKADYMYPYLAFIPIFNIVLMINIGNMSGWYALILLIPIVNIIFAIYYTYKFFASYESGVAVFFIGIICAIVNIFIPFASLIGTIGVWWLAFSDNEFIGEVYTEN